ncbi:MAG: hypothetical protein FIA99_01360 [Ruminiclostridium sp.]|nr:hypothetical protein [Ruminiclostridium sp.]
MGGGFKLICCQCGSDIVLEKSGKSKLDWSGKHIKYGEGIQRKCLNCSNESFEIFKTWLQKS